MGARRPKPAGRDLLTRIKAAPLPPALEARTTSLRRARSPLSYVVSKIPGGRKAVLRLLELATDDEDAQRIASAFHDRAHQASVGSLEDIADRAGISPRDFIGVIARVAYDVNIELGNVIFAVGYPKVMKASIDKAVQPDGVRDREMHLTHSKFLPSKGPLISLHNQNNQQTNVDRDPEPGEAPPFERTARRVIRNLPPA